MPVKSPRGIARQNLIDALIDDRCETLILKGQLVHILRKGFMGFEQMDNLELCRRAREACIDDKEEVANAIAVLEAPIPY